MKAAGITGSYQAAQDTKSGVIAPVLSLTALLPAPPDNPLGIGGATKVTLDVGQSHRSVAAQVIPDVPRRCSVRRSPTSTRPAAPPEAAPVALDTAGLPAARAVHGACRWRRGPSRCPPRPRR